MAKIGLNNFRYAIATINPTTGVVSYGGAKKPAKAISFSFEPNVAEASLYADDLKAEYDSRLTGGTVTMGIDREDATTLADLLGHTKTAQAQSDEITDNVNDTAPYVGIGRVTRLMEDGVVKYRGTVISLVKFSEPSETDNTMGESIEFQTSEISGQMTIPQNGKWRQRKTFNTQADAITYIEGKLGSTATL